MHGTVVTLGGGGFLMSEGRQSPIDDFILELSGKPHPRVCFIPTASGDDPDYIAKFQDAFAPRAQTTVLSLFGRSPWGYADTNLLLEQDVIYVGGGSTVNLLALWRAHGIPDLLRQAATKGTILAGVSAGMNCWFTSSSTDSFGKVAPLQDGLGFLPGSSCPHYLGEPERRAAYLRWIADGALPDGYGVDDFAAIVWRDGELLEAVSEEPNRQVFQVIRTPNGSVECEIPVRVLPRKCGGNCNCAC